MARKARKLTAIMVRLPDPLHRELVRLASAGGRSLNSEIIGRLEKSVALDSPLSADAQRMLSEVEEGMKSVVGGLLEGMKKRDRLEAELLRTLAQIAPKELKKVIGQIYGGEDKS